jgi:adenine/guanine phosphoribosyltransferase-like PRPP-binding protein
VAARHIYTAYDAPAWHPLWEQVVVDRALVLADQRGAAQNAALALAVRLRGEGWDVVLGLNRAGVAGAVALPEKPGFALKAVRDPLRLGPPVLRAIYPGWSGR